MSSSHFCFSFHFSPHNLSLQVFEVTIFIIKFSIFHFLKFCFLFFRKGVLIFFTDSRSPPSLKKCFFTVLVFCFSLKKKCIRLYVCMIKSQALGGFSGFSYPQAVGIRFWNFKRPRKTYSDSASGSFSPVHRGKRISS